MKLMNFENRPDFLMEVIEMASYLDRAEHYGEFISSSQLERFEELKEKALKQYGGYSNE